jgi:hypothetical protein
MPERERERERGGGPRIHYLLEQTQNPCSVLSRGQEAVAQAPQDQMVQKSEQVP